jgi:hypothetical protein
MESCEISIHVIRRIVKGFFTIAVLHFSLTLDEDVPSLAQCLVQSVGTPVSITFDVYLSLANGLSFQASGADNSTFGICSATEVAPESDGIRMQLSLATMLSS